MSCFGQQNVAELMLCEFQSLGLRRTWSFHLCPLGTLSGDCHSTAKPTMKYHVGTGQASSQMQLHGWAQPRSTQPQHWVAGIDGVVTCSLTGLGWPVTQQETRDTGKLTGVYSVFPVSFQNNFKPLNLKSRQSLGCWNSGIVVTMGEEGWGGAKGAS